MMIKLKLNTLFRLNLQSWLPLELHPEINHLLVGFGQVRVFRQDLYSVTDPLHQTICSPVAPKCDQCELSDGLCPSARKIVKGSSSKRSVKVTSNRTPTAGPKIEVALEEESKHQVQSAPLSSTASGLTKMEQDVKVEDIS